MNRTLSLALALAAVASTPSLIAQAAAAATAPGGAAAPTAVAPQAVPAKVAVIAFEQAVIATNEGQRSVADIQKKYEPQRTKIEGEGTEITSLRQQLQALPANTPDQERANREKSLDAKEKQLQRDGEDAQNAYQGELQEAYGKVAQKFGQTMVKYAQDNGFTMVVNVGGSQQAPSPVLWWSQTTDISQAAINAYNTSSGIAAPPPSAPSARRPGGPVAPGTTPRK